MMEFYEQKEHRARKPHKCEMCGGEIKPGELYSCETGKWDGDFFVRKMHPECVAVLNEYCAEVDNEFDYDSIAEYWREHYCERCVHLWPECEPEKGCPKKSEPCSSRNSAGKCTGGDSCDKMTRICWCELFEEKKEDLT